MLKDMRVTKMAMNHLIVSYLIIFSSIAIAKTNQLDIKYCELLQTEQPIIKAKLGLFKTKHPNEQPICDGTDKFNEAVTLNITKTFNSNSLTDPQIELIESDRIFKVNSLPSDPLYSNQWHMQQSNGSTPSINADIAWDTTTGNANLVIAVLDTGYLPHADLADRIIPGYDMINRTDVSNDGDGRDADPSDPGDWCNGNDSTWHGTHTAGIIGAVTDNYIGVSGINWYSKIQPVRVLGQCGGYESDLAMGIRWAAGLSVFRVPTNPTPAKVINISTSAPGMCSITLQSAIDDSVAAGAIIVVAAGNESQNTLGYTPANCNNVITVAAVDASGGKAFYTNYGSIVDIAAPGGDTSSAILSTSNTGKTTPLADSYVQKWGTSMAAPQVSGIISLMASVNPHITYLETLNIIQQTAQSFPTGKANDCDTDNCGAGIIDAAAAIIMATPNTPPLVDAGEDITVYINDTITLHGTASDADGSIILIDWKQTSGTPVTFENVSTLNSNFNSPNTSDILEFTLTVTDDKNSSASDSIQITVKESNIFPSVTANAASSVLSSSPVSLSAFANDADGSIASYQWTQTSGTPVTLINANLASATFTAPDTTDTLTFSITVIDNEGANAFDTISVSVQTPPPAPAANLIPTVLTGSDITAPASSSITLSAMANDADGSIVSYQWTQTSGTPVTLISANLASATFTAPDTTDTLTFSITVIDNRGAIATDSISVTLELLFLNKPPVVVAENELHAKSGDLVELKANALDEDGFVAKYHWIEITSSNALIYDTDQSTASFIAPDVETNLIFVITATDNNGASSKATVEVIVSNDDSNSENDIHQSQTIDTFTEPNGTTENSYGGGLNWFVFILSIILFLNQRK